MTPDSLIGDARLIPRLYAELKSSPPPPLIDVATIVEERVSPLQEPTTTSAVSSDDDQADESTSLLLAGRSRARRRPAPVGFSNAKQRRDDARLQCRGAETASVDVGGDVITAMTTQFLQSI
jgi:hypothetical protein